ncbi:hypothetical protein GJ496_011563 [Pomphorhynchus laevis]|nr:hypothetical protein GJ496_011563 [Pomphorhynchus laevis]
MYNVLIWCLLFHVLYPVVTEGNLDLVIVLFRHGDRTPTWSYPNDIYTETDWPNGFGQLTSKGISQMLALGKRLRSMYSHNLGLNLSTFDAKMIYVRSTDFDRTLMSAISLLQGLYDPGVIVPIHTIESDRDHLLINKVFCPRYKELLRHAFSSEYAKSIEGHLRDLFTKLKNFTKSDRMNIITAARIWDTLFIENIYQRLPSWAVNNWDILETNLSVVRWEMFKTTLLTKEMVQMRTSLLLNEILQIVKRSKHKELLLSMYSVHDSTISALLSSFEQLSTNQPPGYGGFISIEISTNSKGIRSIRVHYAINSTAELKPIEVPCKCPTVHKIKCEGEFCCNIDCFVKSIEDFILTPHELKQHCQIDQNNNTCSSGIDMNIKFMLIVSCFILFLTLFTLIARVRKKLN